jgi:predicted amidohydrolase YtcJ
MICLQPNCTDLSCQTPSENAQSYFGRRQFLRDLVGGSMAVTSLSSISGCATLFAPTPTAETIVINGNIATLNPKQPNASALAITGGKILAIGNEDEVMRHRTPNTRIIDAQKRTIVPGLNDAHTHFIRGGLTYSMEVRWDGLSSLSHGLEILRIQAQRTPSPHWVQVIGGWTWAQFDEKRFPTLAEINAATGDTPAMIMHLYDRAWIARTGMEQRHAQPIWWSDRT